MAHIPVRPRGSSVGQPAGSNASESDPGQRGFERIRRFSRSARPERLVRIEGEMREDSLRNTGLPSPARPSMVLDLIGEHEGEAAALTNTSVLRPSDALELVTIGRPIGHSIPAVAGNESEMPRCLMHDPPSTHWAFRRSIRRGRTI